LAKGAALSVANQSKLMKPDRIKMMDSVYADGYATGMEHAKPCWRCAKTDPPKDDREYMVAPAKGSRFLAKGSSIRGGCLPGDLWLDYPDHPPIVVDTEEKAFEEWWEKEGFARISHLPAIADIKGGYRIAWLARARKEAK